jgi:hypothetical protein
MLGELVREIFLAREQGSDVLLKQNDFAGDSFGGTRADEASGERASQNGGAENDDIANTHEQSS